MTAIHRKLLFRLRQSLMSGFITRPQPRPLVYLGANSSLQLAQAIAEGGNYPSPRFINEDDCRRVLRAISA